jgi:hypothetical protein
MRMYVWFPPEVGVGVTEVQVELVVEEAEVMQVYGVAIAGTTQEPTLEIMDCAL